MERFSIPNNFKYDNNDDTSYTVVKTSKYKHILEEYTKLKNERELRDMKNTDTNKDFKVAELIYELRQKGLLIHMVNPAYVIRVLSEFLNKNFELK